MGHPSVGKMLDFVGGGSGVKVMIYALAGPGRKRMILRDKYVPGRTF